MDIELREISFGVALCAPVLAVAGIVSKAAQPILFPATIFVGGTAVLLFLRMLFSRAYRQGVYALNRELPGTDPWPGRRKKLSDPEWGVFGSRTGPPAQQWLRAILLFGMMPLVFIQKLIGTEVIALWIAGTFLAIELGLMNAAAAQRVERPEPGAD